MPTDCDHTVRPVVSSPLGPFDFVERVDTVPVVIPPDILRRAAETAEVQATTTDVGSPPDAALGRLYRGGGRRWSRRLRLGLRWCDTPTSRHCELYYILGALYVITLTVSITLVWSIAS